MTGKPSEQLLRMADVVKATGLSRQTIQYYLMLGLVHESDRSAGGHRLFDAKAVKRIKLIHKLNQSGYMLREIGEIFLKKG